MDPQRRAFCRLVIIEVIVGRHPRTTDNLVHVGRLSVRRDNRIELLVREGINVVEMPAIILGHGKRRRYQGGDEVEEVVDEHIVYHILHIIVGWYEASAKGQGKNLLVKQ